MEVATVNEGWIVFVVLEFQWKCGERTDNYMAAIRTLMT